MDFQVVGVGEVLWDLLPTGPQLGGAPANFAYHSHALGAQASVITRVGNDEYGREILRLFREMGLPVSTVQVDDTLSTGTAKVDLSRDGLATFTIQQDVAWDHIARSEEALALASHADVICFGSLAQRSADSRDAIQSLIRIAPGAALRVFDINLRQKFYARDVIEQSLQLANVLKLNDDELPIVAAMLNQDGSTGDTSQPKIERQMEQRQIEQLAQIFNLQVVALTRGANGSLLYQQGQWSNCPARATKVVDTVGAGDSFTAALVLGLLHKMALDEINSVANDVARYVCSQPGATPPMPAEFASRFLGGMR